jgi:hypothetical protein
LRLLFPEAEAAEEGVFVFAEAGSGGHGVELFAVAAAEDDVIGIQRRFEEFHDFRDVAAPFLLAQAFEAAKAEIVFVGFPFLVNQVREFHRLEKAVHDHGGAEAGAETEEEHVAAFVAAEGLHRSVIDDFHGEAEGFGEIESHPAATEIVGLAERASVDDGARVADGEAVELPIVGDFLDLFDHAGGGHGGAGREAAGFFLAGGEHFDIGATDVDHQDFRGFGRCFRLHGSSLKLGRRRHRGRRRGRAGKNVACPLVNVNWRANRDGGEELIAVLAAQLETWRMTCFGLWV